MNLEQLKRMAGVGPSEYESWRQVPNKGQSLSESREDARPSHRSQIRSIARMFQDDRLGGYHPLTEAAAEEYAKKAAAHRDSAHGASAKADQSDHPEDHAAAVKAHKMAAKYHGASGNDKAARYHDLKADHHEKRSRVEKDPFKSEPKKSEPKKAKEPKQAKAEPGKKKGLLGRLKDKIVAKVKGASGIDWAAKSKEIAKKDKKTKPAPSDAETMAATRSRAMARVAKRPEWGASKKARSAEKSGSSVDRAKARHQAGDEHLHKALTHFHAGDHDAAVKALNRAIKHKKRAAGHESDVAAQGRQAARRLDPVGPRAQVGFARR